MRLLIAEDDPRLLKSLLHIFTSNQYAADGVSNGTDALDYARTGEYDGFVFDIMMPGADGLTVLSTLRREGITTPTLFLTARTEVDQRVEGLDAGADDYLPKPFGMMELLARVKALLRRAGQRGRPEEYRIDGLRVCPETRLVQADGQDIALTLKEFELLKLFLEHPGRVFTRDQLLERIWSTDYVGETRTVDVHIGTLRTKLGQCGEYIRTVRGVGYRMEA